MKGDIQNKWLTATWNDDYPAELLFNGWVYDAIALAAQRCVPG